MEKYLNFFFEELPDPIGFPLYMISSFTIVITIVITIYLILVNGLNISRRSECLGSQLARRYSDWVCEEYYDNKWIEVDLSETIYHYNEAASRNN